ncbi:MAG: hypothetical protein M1469_11905 [Bacteroidetes bacterium]|nr:hypothetical protein [Bacteroidota bacterium]
MHNEDSLQVVPLIDTTLLVVPNSVLLPKLSPDRKLIAFYATKSYAHEGTMLCVVGVNGKNLRRIAVVTLPGQIFQGGLNWSPDGQRIAFSSPKGAANSANNIYIIGADGTGEVQITNDNCFNIRPKWSFDGKLIAFIRIHPFSPAGFAVYDLSTSKMLELTTNSTGYFWSPNTSSLAYTAKPANPSSRLSKDLCVMRYDSSVFTQPVVLHGSAYSGTNMWIWGGWNPSGNAILIATSNDTGAPAQNAQVLLVNAQTGDSKFIMPVQDPGRATWSSDGRRIFFTRWRPNPMIWGGFDLYAMNSDGSNQKLLIQDIEDPDW